MLNVRMVASQGWRFQKQGPANKVLQWEKFRLPFDRSSSQVVVKMLAAPVHKHDKNLIEGTYGPIKPLQYPAIGGTEGVGIVEEMGDGVSLGVKPGDMVWINNQRVGTWATHIVTDATNVDVVPNRADLDVEYLSSLSTFHTAWHLIHSMTQLSPGDVVLQAGAASAVSQVCMTYARSRGAKIFYTMQSGRSEHQWLQGKFKLCGAYCVVPYSYSRSNYMNRLLSDVRPPKLLLNGVSGPWGSHLVRLLGNDATVVNYGSASSRPMQIANMDGIARGITQKGFFLPTWNESHSREYRMRIHQNVVESLLLSQGHSQFRCQRFKMDTDSMFAFSNAWDAPLTSRKSILRMVGEYGEWRKPRAELQQHNFVRCVWEDLIQQLWECTGASDTPQSMKYYTPFGDFYSEFKEARQSRQMGHREIFYKRPNAPRHNTDESAIYESKQQ